MPFITEALWAALPHRASDPELLIVARWPAAGERDAAGRGRGRARSSTWSGRSATPAPRRRLEPAAWLPLDVVVPDARGTTLRGAPARHRAAGPRAAARAPADPRGAARPPGAGRPGGHRRSPTEAIVGDRRRADPAAAEADRARLEQELAEARAPARRGPRSPGQRGVHGQGPAGRRRGARAREAELPSRWTGSGIAWHAERRPGVGCRGATPWRCYDGAPITQHPVAGRTSVPLDFLKRKGRRRAAPAPRAAPRRRRCCPRRSSPRTTSSSSTTRARAAKASA